MGICLLELFIPFRTLPSLSVSLYRSLVRSNPQIEKDVPQAKDRLRPAPHLERYAAQ